MSEEFERIVEFYPAYDKRHPNPHKDHGIADVWIKFILKGKKGAVQFLMSTGWFLPETVEDYKSKGINLMDRPRGWDLGYHSPKPMYEGQEPATENCPILGGKCYYDGSTLAAEKILEILLREGSNGVWKALERYYYETFEQEAET